MKLFACAVMLFVMALFYIPIFLVRAILLPCREADAIVMDGDDSAIEWMDVEVEVILLEPDVLFKPRLYRPA